MNPSVPIPESFATFLTFVFSLFYMKTWICPVDTWFNLTTDMCESCPLQGCLVCASLKQCSVCDSANLYELNSTTFLCDLFVEVCGDGRITPSEQCDDANVIDSDGCSSNCIVEQDYVCLLDTTIGFSSCAYSPITLEIMYIEKSDMANQI